VILSFQHKGLRELLLHGNSADVPVDLQKRCIRRLDALNRAAKLQNVNLPGFNFHPLKGNKPQRYSIHVNGPGRLHLNGRMEMS
jgi:toxin HigB-1